LLFMLAFGKMIPNFWSTLLFFAVSCVTSVQLYARIQEPFGDPKDVKIVDGKYKSCQELFEHGYKTPGVYPLHLSAHRKNKTFVFCNNTEAQSGVIILYRYSGMENFARGWYDYRLGFGSPHTDYFVGLDNIIKFISQGQRVLNVVAQDWSGRTAYARYSLFSLDPYPRYTLRIGGHSGTLPDDLWQHNGQEFYTKDRPDPHQCVAHQKVGWWYNYCAYALPTGYYYRTGHYKPVGQFYDGVYWSDWLGYDYSLRFLSFTLTPN